MAGSGRPAAAASLAVALGLAAGCAWVPPVPVPRRPEFAILRQRVRDALSASLELAVPPADGLRDVAVREGRVAVIEPDPEAQGRAVAEAVRALGLFRSVTVARGGAGRPAGFATGRSEATYALSITPRRSEVEYVGMASNWPLSFVVWAVGGPAGWWVRDETFAGRVAWDARLLDTGTGLAVAERLLEARVEKDLDDWDRGWSLWDMLVYAAAPVSEGTLRKAAGKVLPFAEAEATLALCRWLVEDVRPRLEAEPKPPETAVPLPAPAPPAPGPPAPSRSRVLSVGVSDYEDDPDAAFAAEDAEAAAAALARALDLDPADVTVLLDREATSEAIRSWLDTREAEGLGAADRAVVFFAGRGATDEDGEPYLLPFDGRAGSPREAGVPLRRLAEAIAAPGEATILLDCAFQGRLDERGPGSERVPLPAAKVLPGRRGLRLLAAAYGRGEATARAGLGHGVFTSSLLSALGGRADADNDGATTLGEAADHVLRETRPVARRGGVEEVPAILAGDRARVLVGRR